MTPVRRLLRAEIETLFPFARTHAHILFIIIIITTIAVDIVAGAPAGLWPWWTTRAASCWHCPYRDCSIVSTAAELVRSQRSQASDHVLVYSRFSSIAAAVAQALAGVELRVRKAPMGRLIDICIYMYACVCVRARSLARSAFVPLPFFLSLPFSLQTKKATLPPMTLPPPLPTCCSAPCS